MLLRDSLLAMTALILFNFAVFSLFPGLTSHGNTNHGLAKQRATHRGDIESLVLLLTVL